jgi:hypothetical protein
MAARTRSDRRWPGAWWWLVLAVVVLPMIGSGIQRTTDGWYPESDDATITLLARDTFGGPIPLVGMVSTGGEGLDDPELHHPGPLELYVLAPFAHVPGGPVPTTVAVVLVNLLATATTGLAFRRLGGDAAGILGLLAVGLATWGVGGDVPASVWNPDVVVLPFAALVAASAVVASGGHRWLPVQVALASFVAQTHLSYVGLVAVLVAWAVAVTAWDLRRHPDPVPRRDRWRSVGIAGLVGLVLWLAPLVQQVTGSPGNLSQIVRSFAGPGGESVGSGGLAELGRVTGLPLLGAAPPGDLVVDAPPASVLGLARLLVPFLAAVGIVVVSRRRGDGVARRLAATAAVVMAAGVATAARMPLADGILYRYYSRWMWPLAAIAWALLALAALRVARPTAPAADRAATVARPAPLAGWAAAIAIAVVLTLLPRPGTWAPWQVQRRAAGDVAEATADAVRAGGADHARVRFRGGTSFLSTGSAVALAIEDAGVATTIDAGPAIDIVPWGDHRAPDRTPAEATDVWVVSGPDPADLPADARLVAETRLIEPRRTDAIEAATRRWRDRIERTGVEAGRRRADDPSTAREVRVALADPLAAFDRGGLGDLAARGLVTLPSGSVDDLYTLDRLRALTAEATIRTYVVDPG